MYFKVRQHTVQSSFPHVSLLLLHSACYLENNMRPCSLLEEQERNNSSSLMTVTLLLLSWTWAVRTWVLVPGGMWVLSSVCSCCDWDCRTAEFWSWLSLLGRFWSIVGAGCEASLHRVSSSVCCWVSSARVRIFICSATTWTGQKVQDRLNETDILNKTQQRRTGVINKSIFTQ